MMHFFIKKDGSLESDEIINIINSKNVKWDWLMCDKAKVKEFYQRLDDLVKNGVTPVLVGRKCQDKDGAFFSLSLKVPEGVVVLCETAQKYGITVLLEPLGPRYSNYINTIEEAVDICKILKADNLFTMCDLRHMVDSHDNFSNIIKYGKYIRHVHIDNPLLYPQRIYPEQEDGYDYSEYFRALQKIDYDGTLTVEADIPQNYLDSCLSMKSFLSAYGVLTESDR